MARGVNEEQESGEDVESQDHEETEKGYGYTQPLSGYLLDTKILTININAPDRTEVSQDHKEFQEQEIRVKHELEEEPEKHPLITSWEYDANKDNTILDLVQSKMPLTEVLYFVAEHCPNLRDLRLHANVQVPEFVSIGDLQSRSKDFGYKSDEKDLSELRVHIRFRHQETSIPFYGLLMIMSLIFPNISDLTIYGEDETELRIWDYLYRPTVPKLRLLPEVRKLTLKQFIGSISLLMLLNLVILHLSNLPLLRIIKCNVDLDVQVGSEIMKKIRSKSNLRHLEIIPVTDIPFTFLYELVFKVCNNCLNLNNFIVQNCKAKHISFQLLKWTKTKHELYLKQSSPLKDFKDIMSIVKKFPYIRKLEADECGSFERSEILEIVKTCSSLQYLSSVANGKRSTLAISDQNLMRESASEPISKSFGRLGGELIFEKYGIILNVPEGAIEREGEIDIGLQVLTNPPSTHLQGDEMVCSFGFRCTIPKLPGLRFAKPVKVTVPHSAILEVHPSEVHVGMYSGELWHDTGDVHKDISTISYNWPSKGSLPRCELGTNEISVFIDHFSFGWPVLKIRNPFNLKKHVRGKMMGCLPFVPNQMPPTRKPVLRVHLFDHLKGNPEEIQKEESDCDFQKALPKFYLHVKSNLDVTYQMDGRMPEDKSMYTDPQHDDEERPEKRQCFNVNFRGDSRESSSSVTSRRRSNDEFDEIILKQVARELHQREDIDNLGDKLGISVPDRCRFIEQNSTNGVNSRGTLDMLRTWRSGVDNSEKESILRDALRRAGLINLLSRLFPELEDGAELPDREGNTDST
ncbi:uncharacterized protein LOC121427169 isoform X2 [Lytechinus variegatus]|uniref:uncharacterized protein LOC121427169 isoform X2 n=1 Tax=Lytechinus variegatus TaxID=7654 RepID=UPI001BB24AFF|nr:uncharacterized protein LOC121427169 isoform X2 [Lytechinus variegatus]